MPYARTSWIIAEVERALGNPVNAPAGPHAHSSKHATAGELANNPMFQRARVTALVVDDNQKERNVGLDLSAASPLRINPLTGANLSSADWAEKKKPLQPPKPEAATHSTLAANLVAAAVTRALNAPLMQPHLATLDVGTDIKVRVNFPGPIGTGMTHSAAGSVAQVFVGLFIYAKPNPGNTDVPIFQTVYPVTAPAAPGANTVIVPV